MLQHIRNLFGRRNQDGASAVEYGLLVALIAAVIVAVVFTLGSTLKDAFTTTNDCIENPSTATSC